MAMAKRECSNCLDTLNPVRDALEVINGKWKLPILISVSVGNERFNAIQESILGISARVLAKELKDLERHQLISRTVTYGQPAKIIYRTEPYAETLKPVIYALKDWGVNHKHKMAHPDKDR
ncbi:helix-turn-helix transcriptional regulator [Chryseobacterium sp. cx-311]|nr:helix-turn-helix transcriptional regulator [Marnyiella aurantia]